MKKLLMFLYAVKSIFTDYAKLRAYIFNDDYNRGTDSEIETYWSRFEADKNKILPREAAISKLRNKNKGFEVKPNSTIGFDGVMPKTERRGNPKRKRYSQKLYFSNKDDNDRKRE